VGVLVLLAAAALAAWAALSRSLDPPKAWLAAGAVCLVVLAGTLLRAPRPQRLRWDGEAWRLGPSGSAGQDGEAVDVAVTVDLGVWMLLRVRSLQAPRWRPDAWLPAQRRGHEAHWHALRCAVYSPRPSPGGPPEAEP
jgi:hypothetical protein